MSRASSEMELLGTLAEMPFLDRLELAALSGWSKGAVYRSVAGLEQRGLVASVPHATPVVTPTRRYHLTADGLGRLAEATGDSVDRLLLTHPVSHSWLRLLLERLDGAAERGRASPLSCGNRPAPLHAGCRARTLRAPKTKRTGRTS